MPRLIIIAGCNGAGKSTFASSFLPEGLTSFDFDRIFLDYYNSLPDSELREKFSRDYARKEFNFAIEKAIQKKSDFCYETNFDSDPIYWAKIFRDNDYQVNLIFFCLEKQEIARHRIQVRTEFKGHFIDNKTIDLKWKAGYKNLNIHFNFFDNILIVDNSIQNQVYTNILQIEEKKIVLMTNKIPNYFNHRLPDITKLINQ